jgi:hypothetical protein
MRKLKLSVTGKTASSSTCPISPRSLKVSLDVIDPIVTAVWFPDKSDVAHVVLHFGKALYLDNVLPTCTVVQPGSPGQFPVGMQLSKIVQFFENSMGRSQQ